MTCRGEPVARLADVIEALRPYPAVTLRIEIKNTGEDSSDQRTADAVMLARQLADTGMTARSILQDFDWATTTAAIRAASPGQRVSALATSISTTKVDAARSAGAYDFSYPVERSTAFWNRYVAAKGLRSTVWTVNDTVRARAVRAGGVGTVISDVPATLREAFAAPGSGCSLTRYYRTTPLRVGVTPLATGGRLYLKAPTTAPDGRIVETTLVQDQRTHVVGHRQPAHRPAGDALQHDVGDVRGADVELEEHGGRGGARQRRQPPHPQHVGEGCLGHRHGRRRQGVHVPVTAQRPDGPGTGSGNGRPS